jgi:hypothetical protein
LVVIPGTHWRPVNFAVTTIMFIYVSHRVAQATGDITAWICGGVPKLLPVPATSIAARTATFSSSRRNGMQAEERLEVMIPLTSHSEGHVRKDNDGSPLPPEPDTPTRPRRWVDRLAEGTTSQSYSHSLKVWCRETRWNFGVKGKLALGLSLMWVVNLMWTYS